MKYIGGFKSNKFNGLGIEFVNTTKENTEYKNFMENLNDGEIHVTKYEGLFINNIRDGIGYLHYDNGDYFLGEFSQN